jgi:chromosome partitioning protein
MKTRVISVINLKGGVVKSTLTMIFAEYLTFIHHKRVLVIDIDSQYLQSTKCV